MPRGCPCSASTPEKIVAAPPALFFMCSYLLRFPLSKAAVPSSTPSVCASMSSDSAPSLSPPSRAVALSLALISWPPLLSLLKSPV